MNTKVGLLVLTAVTLTSCGGGGSSVPIHPQTTYRANVVGDSWTYNVNINFGQFSGKGSLVRTLSSDTYNGSPSIRDSQDFTITANGQTSSSTSYSEISPDGVLLAVMINTVLYGVTANTFNTGNTIDASTTAKGVITLTNGDTLNESYKVEGAELCSTPAGDFACWITSQTVVNSDGTTDHFTMWIAPETGTYVKIQDKTTNPGNVGYTYTATLNSMVSGGFSDGTSKRAARPYLPPRLNFQ